MIKLSLIGMSGAGKSHWTDKLVAAGFRSIRVDDLIEQKLASELRSGGYRGIEGLAEWMGWPNRPEYAERERKYLQCEIEAMREALDEIELRSEDEGVVLDTTGSVIYTGDEIYARLKNLTTVTYLEASLDEEELLIARYLHAPKPVLWGETFSQHSSESAKNAVKRCYPDLIARRKQLYERYADRVVPVKRLRDPELDARGFLELLESQARHAR